MFFAEAESRFKFCGRSILHAQFPTEAKKEAKRVTQSISNEVSSNFAFHTLSFIRTTEACKTRLCNSLKNSHLLAVRLLFLAGSISTLTLFLILKSVLHLSFSNWVFSLGGVRGLVCAHPSIEHLATEYGVHIFESLPLRLHISL